MKMPEAFTDPLWELAAFRELQDQCGRGKTPLFVSGLADAQKPHLIRALGTDPVKKLIVTYSEQRAREIMESYRAFVRDDADRIRYFPAKDFLFYQSDVRGNALLKERIACLKNTMDYPDAVVVTTCEALAEKLPSEAVLRASCPRLAAGDEIDLEEMQRQLVCMGYECVTETTGAGQFSVRGGILDIFPLTGEYPVRIELWGDEIDTIRTFYPDTQRSAERLECITLSPAGDVLFPQEALESGLCAIQKDADALCKKFKDQCKTEEAHRLREQAGYYISQIRDFMDPDCIESCLPYFTEGHPEYEAGLYDYFAEDGLIFIDEPARCADAAKRAGEEFGQGMERRLETGHILPGQCGLRRDGRQVTAYLAEHGAVLLSVLEGGSPAGGFERAKRFTIRAQGVPVYNNSFPLLVKDLAAYKKKGYRTILLCRSEARAKRMAADLTEEGINAFCTDDPGRVLQPGELLAVSGNLPAGFVYPDCRFIVISETDIFGARKKRSTSRKSGGRPGTSFMEFEPGDYVVHENHGIGIYRGIEKVTVEGRTKDYIKIEYAKGGILYVLATQTEAVKKYAAKDAKKPRLSSLGSVEWKRTRRRVEKAVSEIAEELVELYAVRQNTSGYRYAPDTDMQREFEELFPYEETSDQLRAIEETKADMESDKIMDRLLCGDVGYGKTEVAIRAAFKAVAEGRQVVYLVPTTILAQQHYTTFTERMKDFAVEVRLLCRFCTASEAKETVAGLKSGLVDIVIGTHRILSKDVAFKDLGLLIIDEEQRFGVTHKERIKQMRRDVDVLALTATPIPRTLHMSLIGIRDLSILDEPPSDRMPIQTYIMEYEEEMIREAIARELARNGQVYFVYNRVRSIGEITAKVASLVPDAAVEYAHGQMSQQRIEDIMYRFIGGGIDVLVSTTIIETGIDIPNVNTMIIYDADKFGLAQLYQLRGRVGRSNRTAYAFLTYRRGKELKEEAAKRLAAIRNFSDLGSGIRIAQQDLQMRGAGNLLGEAQSGHMEAVGYELYCQMLGEAVRAARQDGAKEPVKSRDYETTLDLRISAYIPQDYIADERVRLQIYKRIAAIASQEERDDMLDELIDRFGEPPKPVQNLLTVALYRHQAHRLWFTDITERRDELELVLYEQAGLDPAKIPGFLQQYGSRLRFLPNGEKPKFIYKKKKTDLDMLGFVGDFLQNAGRLL